MLTDSYQIKVALNREIGGNLRKTNGYCQSIFNHLQKAGTRAFIYK